MTNNSARSNRRLLKWLVPPAAAVLVAAGVGVALVATAAPILPDKSAAALLVDVAGSKGTPLSGTVVETARLGLPALPEITGAPISPVALLTGSHTARIWYDGKDKARVALVGDLAETDLIRNGRDVWLWTSGQNTAQHAVLPVDNGTKAEEAAPGLGDSESLTPQKVAEQALAAIDSTTQVSVDGAASVAGRPAYELVLAPRDARSLVGSVRIAVDSETSVPLRVQIHAAGATGRPAFETAFTSVTFEKPDASVFRFTPPPGTTVTNVQTPMRRHDDGDVDDPKRGEKERVEGKGSLRPPGGAGAPRVIGSGWTSVAEVSGVSLSSIDGGGGGDDGPGSAASQLSAMTNAMTPVQGAYGKGRLLRTSLVSVLLLDDGRLFIGAVAPEVLEQAAAK